MRRMSQNSKAWLGYEGRNTVRACVYFAKNLLTLEAELSCQGETGGADVDWRVTLVTLATVITITLKVTCKLGSVLIQT